MNPTGSKITLKVFLSYILLGALVVGAGGFVFSEINEYTKVQKDDIADKNKIIRIGNILTSIYENESLGRAAIQADSKKSFQNYLLRNDRLYTEIDTVKTMVDSEFQKQLLDSVKVLLNKKTTNLTELRSLAVNDSSERALETAIQKLTSMEASLGTLNLEDFVKNPELMDSELRKNTEEFIGILNKYKPRDSTKTLDQATVDSILASSKTLLRQVKDDATKQRNSVKNKETQLIENDLIVSQQLRKLLSGLENEMFSYSSNLNIKREATLKKSFAIISFAVIAGIILVIIFSVMIVNDYWKSQRYRKQLEKANKYTSALLNSREQLISMVSHDLRTPLSTIVGYTELLKNTPMEGKGAYYLDRIQTSSSYVNRLVEDLLDFSRLESGKVHVESIPYDLHKLISETAFGVQTLFASKEIELKVDLDKRIQKAVVGDPIRTRQILFNLIGNAFKFTEKGHVRVKTVLSSFEPFKVYISVEDSGIGIKKEKQDIIFNEFTQADGNYEKKYGGFGLGLTISQKLTGLLNGSLSLQSEEGQGSTFTLTLPVKFSSEKLTVIEESRPRSKKLLKAVVIDDDPTLLELLKETLEKSEILVYSYTNGNEALKTIPDHVYDFIITDIQLPTMNGFRFLELLKKDTPNYQGQPIIAITGRRDINKDHYLSSGFSGVIFKPFQPKELLSCIEHLTGASIKSNAPEHPKPGSYPDSFQNFRLHSLRSFLNDDEKEVKKTLCSFVKDTQNNLSLLNYYTEHRNLEQLQDLCHKMSTMFRQLEARRIIPILDMLQTEKLYDDTEREVLVQHLEKNIIEVIHEIKVYLN